MRWNCTDELADAYVHRPLAGLIVRAVEKTPVTPDHLTLFSMGLGLCGALYLALGHPIAAALIVAHLVFDCSDGQLARMRRPTRLGRILDGASDTAVGIALYLALVAQGIPWAVAAVAGASLFLRGTVFDGLKMIYQGAADIPLYTAVQKWLIGDAPVSERFLRAASFLGPTTHHVLLAAAVLTGAILPFLVTTTVLSNGALAFLMLRRFDVAFHAAPKQE